MYCKILWTATIWDAWYVVTQIPVDSWPSSQNLWCRQGHGDQPEMGADQQLGEGEFIPQFAQEGSGRPLIISQMP